MHDNATASGQDNLLTQATCGNRMYENFMKTTATTIPNVNNYRALA